MYRVALGLGVVVVLILGVSWLVSSLVTGDETRLLLERQASNWMGEPVRIDDAEVTLFPRPGIELTNVRVGEPVRTTLAEVAVSTDLSALLRRRIHDAEVVVSDSRLEMPMLRPRRGHSTRENPDAASNGIEIVSVRQISMRNVQLVSRDYTFTVSLDSALDEGVLTINELSAASGSIALEIDGAITLSPALHGTLGVHAQHLDLDALLALTQGFVDQDVRSEEQASAAAGREIPVRLAIDIRADTATVGGVDLTRLETRMNVRDTRAVLSPLTFGMFGGRHDGSLDVAMAEPMHIALQSRVEGLDVAQLVAFGGSDGMSGRLSGTVTVEASGSDLATALAAVQGEGRAVIVDGQVRGLDLVRTVVLFFGRPVPDTLAATDEFDRIEAEFSVRDQVVHADPFTMRSRDADVDGTVTLALSSTSLDGSLQLRLSEELSAQAGTDLMRVAREGSRVVLPALVHGTLDAPRLTIDSSDAVQRGLRNEVERRIKRLFGR